MLVKQECVECGVGLCCACSDWLAFNHATACQDAFDINIEELLKHGRLQMVYKQINTTYTFLVCLESVSSEIRVLKNDDPFTQKTINMLLCNYLEPGWPAKLTFWLFLRLMVNLLSKRLTEILKLINIALKIQKSFFIVYCGL